MQIRRESLAAKNDQLLLSYLSLLRRSRALSYAMIQDDAGRVIAHTNPTFINQRLTDPLSIRAAESTGLLRQQGGPADDVVDLAIPILQGLSLIHIFPTARSASGERRELPLT